MDQPAETRMDKVKGEAKVALAEIAMCHGEIAGRKPLRQRQPQTTELERIEGAGKAHRLVHHRYGQRHADAEADIFLKACGTCGTLAGMDRLRKAGSAPRDAGPGLATGGRVPRHADGYRRAPLIRQRQRTADGAHSLCEPPARPAAMNLFDL